MPRANKPPVNPAKLVFNKVARPGSAVGSHGAELSQEDTKEPNQLHNQTHDEILNNPVSQPVNGDESNLGESHYYLS